MAVQLNLQNLGGGAAVEKFQLELDRVMANIMDINTTDGKREITLKVEFRPAKDRESCNLLITCASKLAPYEPFESKAYLGVGRSGRVEVYESNPEQLGLFEQRDPDGNVVDIREVKP